MLADTEDTWTAIFQAAGRQYVPPKLDLFAQQINTGCGFADSGAGPFYCPADSKVYLDPSFFQELQSALPGARRLRAGLCHRARGGASRAEPARH